MEHSLITIPRLVISGVCGGSGKTLVSLGLCRFWSTNGLRIKPYKKGPDYIDAAWLGMASTMPATNLDPFFLPEQRLQALFCETFQQSNAELAVIEGNRGLYDGRDLSGSCSTAVLARMLDAPILITLNITKMTRTAAALVAGLACFEPIRLSGVILNQVGSIRQGRLVRQAIEAYTDVPVLGELPRLAENPIPERHMGLISIYAEDVSDASEADSLQSALDTLAAFLAKNVDVDTVRSIAFAASTLFQPSSFWPEAFFSGSRKENIAYSKSVLSDMTASENTRVSTLEAAGSTLNSVDSYEYSQRVIRKNGKARIGFVRDAALWFYYEENLEALRRAGAELYPLSLLGKDKIWPALDGLYLGGGFPEAVPETLAASPQLETIRRLSEKDMPIYAECGGFMILCETLRVGEKDYPMAGVFPARAEFCSRPQGLGYVEALVVQDNPFHPLGNTLRGHEFHYSRCYPLGPLTFTLKLETGTGMSLVSSPGSASENRFLTGEDGLLVRRTFASYMHLFAPAVPHWAQRFVLNCQ